MVGITTYVPKEIFLDKVTSLGILLSVAIILFIIFFVYKFYEFGGKRKRPESF